MQCSSRTGTWLPTMIRSQLAELASLNAVQRRTCGGGCTLRAAGRMRRRRCGATPSRRRQAKSGWRAAEAPACCSGKPSAWTWVGTESGRCPRLDNKSAASLPAVQLPVRGLRRRQRVPRQPPDPAVQEAVNLTVLHEADARFIQLCISTPATQRLWCGGR